MAASAAMRGPSRIKIMRSIIKSTFLWQFAAGFALGALGMVTLTPADTFTASFATTQQQSR
jgi:hypothetical protein